MNDRRRASTRVCDNDGEPLIDAAVLRMVLQMTGAGARKWATRHGLQPVRRGAHGASLYRLADVQEVLERAG